MNIQPATDNLYKFIAILGVAIFLGSTWMASELWKSEAEQRDPLVKEAMSLFDKDGKFDELEMAKIEEFAKYRNRLIFQFWSLILLQDSLESWLRYTVSGSGTSSAKATRHPFESRG